jgi:exocyst complex component 2
MVTRYVLYYFASPLLAPGRPLPHIRADAVRLHELETWDLDTELPATTQFLTKILQKFQIHSATLAYKIAGGIDVSKHGAIAAKQLPIGREFSQRIQKTFVDSLYALLDGLEKLSRQDYTPVASASFDVTAAPLVAQVAVDPNDRVGSCPSGNER